ncbi:carbon storage regulator [Pseudomonas veronii]|uniref:Carbon storage regulator n=1 Tax=Pseudomonas veronii TaxID=76761 RepID=A0A4P7Y7S4_PSEVE|nr:carbon storage regulator [Pseudomonas veronii]QCG66573.1 carbon storage regulator [Pseudomonas veronii]
MLVLSRTVGEIISIGDDIALHIPRTQRFPGEVRGSSPAEVSVHRAEVYQKIVERQDTASHPLPNP